MIKRVVLGVVLTAAVLAGLGWPKLRVAAVLVAEGFPAEVWPARGRFEEVAGDGRSFDPAPDLPAEAAELFEGSGGRALLVEQNGVLEGAAYGEGFGPDTRFNSFSMVKSLVGILVVKAVAEGRVASFDTGLRTILGPEAPDLTIRQLLDMTGGLSATGEPVKTSGDEAYSPFSDLGHLHVRGPAAVLAEFDIDAAKAGTFHYQSANTALLGLVLEEVTGQPLAEHLSEEIWHPAGAGPAQWRGHPEAAGVSAYCCLYATASDWLRVGRFLLDNGTEAAPFLPDDIWASVFLPELAAEARRAGAYRTHMRHDVLDREGAGVSGPFAYFMGHGGQVLHLMPGEDAVVVRFGERPQLLHSTLYVLLVPG